MINKVNKPILVTLLTHIYVSFHIYGEPMIYHNIGNLHFSHQKWEFRYDLNLSSYYDISTTLEECIINLKDVCKNLNETSCETFLLKANHFQDKIQLDISNVRDIQRSKRELITFGFIIAGTTIMSLVAAIAAQSKALEKIKVELTENLNTIERLSETSQNMIDIQESHIETLQKSMDNMTKQIVNITNVMHANNKLNNIIDYITMTMMEHNMIQNKLINIYSGNKKLQILSLINFRELSNEIKHINSNLKPNFTLPKIISIDSLTDIQNQVKKTQDGISVSIYLPVIDRREYTIFEMIPVPFIKDQNVYIINETKTVFIAIENDILTLDVNKAQCQKFENTVVCNNMIEDYFEKANNCSIAMINSNDYSNCVIKELPRKNYVTQLNKKSIHFTIVEALLIKILCAHSEEKIELKESQTIEFNDDCTVYRDTVGKSINGQSIFDVNMTFIQPNIHFFDRKTQTWNESLEILSKFEVKFLKIREKLNEIDTELPNRKKLLDSIEIRSQFDILEFLGIKKYIETIIIIILALLFGSIIIFSLIKCLFKKLFKC